MSTIINGSTNAITFPDATIQTTAALTSGGSLTSATITALNTSGITFPATQVPSSDPNTLDDYEEGTWTPVITGSISNPVSSGTANQATYVKVGRIVTLNFYLQGGFSSAGSGDLRLTGIPFASAATTQAMSGPAATYQCSFGGNIVVWQFNITTTMCLLGSNNNGGAWTQQQVNALNSGLYAITGTVTYLAAS